MKRLIYERMQPLFKRHIRCYRSDGERFVKGMEFEDFKQDDKTASAVIRKFEIIGEASKKIPAAIKKKYPEIPWREMAGMRDKLIHFYFGIDYRLVWQSIKNRIPQIKSLINKITIY